MRPRGQEIERTDPRLRISRPDEAETLVQSALNALDQLEPLIEEETRLFRIGKIKDALGMALQKNEIAQSYTRLLEVLKTNAIAIGRFQPSGLGELKARHETFSSRMSINLAVVTTAKTVSEGVMRDLADALGRNASPKTYANGRIVRKAGTVPLALSKTI